MGLPRIFTQPFRNSGRSPNYLDAEEVVELLHVRHLELVGKEGLNFVDVYEIIHI